MAGRRGRGEGAIYKRADGFWCASITVGYDEKGKRRRRTVYGQTKTEVREKLARLHADSVTGSLVVPSRETLGAFLLRWLEDVARTTVRATTHMRYESLVRTHILPRVGGLGLAKLEPRQVQALYSRMETEGAGPRTIELVHAVLHRALDQAVKWGLLMRNPTDAAEKPRVPKRKMQTLSPEQARQLLEAAKEDRLEAVFVLAVATGLRQGELLALHWEDIDLDGGMLMVRHTLQDVRGELRLEEPKTSKGRRRVDLPAFAVEALRRHKDRMAEEGHDKAWVFCDNKGGPLRVSNFLRRSFLPLLQRAGLPRIRFHDLRHTAATLLLSKGVHPKVVQERLGHAQIAITLDTYSHVLPSMQREAASKLDDLLGGPHPNEIEEP